MGIRALLAGERVRVEPYARRQRNTDSLRLPPEAPFTFKLRRGTLEDDELAFGHGRGLLRCRGRRCSSNSERQWCGGAQTWQSVRGSLDEPAIRVKALVARVYYASNARGQPTFIDLGNPSPSRNRVTVVIWGEDRVNFPRAPERMFKPGQVSCAQGAASMYSGAPQIQVALWDAESRLLSF